MVLIFRTMKLADNQDMHDVGPVASPTPGPGLVPFFRGDRS